MCDPHIITCTIFLSQQLSHHFSVVTEMVTQSPQGHNNYTHVQHTFESISNIWPYDKNCLTAALDIICCTEYKTQDKLLFADLCLTKHLVIYCKTIWGH